VLEDNAKTCNWCGAEVAGKAVLINKRIYSPIIIASVVFVMVCVAIFVAIFTDHSGSGKNTDLTKPGKTSIVKEPNTLKPSSKPNKEPANNSDLNKDTNSNGSVENLFYMKDNRVYHTSLDTIKTKEVIHSLYSYLDVTDPIYVSEDGQKLFYPQNHKEGVNGFTIFGCDLRSKTTQPMMIDYKINSYTVNQDGTKVYYFKGTDLYLRDKSRIKKIDSGVSRFMINKEGNWIVYETMNGALYQKKGNQKKEKIEDNASVQYVSKDLKTIYYIQYQTLYQIKDGKNITKIASGVDFISYVYKDDTVYYQHSIPVKLSDYIIDDLVDKDAEMKIPLRDDYSDDRIFQKDLARYQRKLERDSLRRDMESTGMSASWYYLYCYSNGKSKLISDRCTNVWGSSDMWLLQLGDDEETSQKEPYIVYSQLKEKDIGKIKISECSNIGDVYERIVNPAAHKQEYYLCNGLKMIEKLGADNLTNFTFNTMSNRLYYYEYDGKDNNKGNLFCVTLDGDLVSKAEKVVENTSPIFRVTKDNDLIIFKNVTETNENQSTGDLYLNNKKIDSNVDVITVTDQLRFSNAFPYYKDGKNGNYFTLMFYDNGKTSKIADKVRSYYRYEDNKIAYITTDDHYGPNGSLYLYDGLGRSLHIDSAVRNIITPATHDYFTIQSSNY
jgi:hypothetical protein